ncbi:hypothetical protein TELCIR_05369 [Teladorsagia circumcincta]|uniref:Rubicon Homology domain-containing protein n=1 Tax=Teladorsagia circumcincta TaxID=45464 RepID=A0A2G9URC5_TELCI|nr:hypothetical protein TELCIR_05369 [Teladorsagia circumcincta]
MSTFSNHEKSKTGIIKELETVLKAAKSSPYIVKDCISSQFYDDNALLRDVEQMKKVSELLKNLDQLPICAAVNSSFLNTWTPSPLILAGLVDGKPLKEIIHSDDDESVYSHPSMINDSERIPERIILSSSPLNNGYGELLPQNVATSTRASCLTELGTSVISVNHTRMRPSETLDSGIDSENRDPNPETISSVSDDKGRELIDASLSPINASEEPSVAGTEIFSNNFNGSGTDPPATTLVETLHPSAEIDAVPLSDDARANESTKTVDDMADDVFDEEVNTSDTQNDGAVSIPRANAEEERSYGASLHDELILADVKPGSNSLLNRSWKKPTTTSELDLDDTRELGFEADVEDIDDEQKSPSRKESAALLEQVATKMTTIPREAGLDSQDFRCPMCRKSIGAAFSKYGVCGIDGMYYCADCMRAGGEMPVPARILRSWDWKPRPVSDRGRAFIEANQDNVIIHIDQHNPSLYNHVPLLKAMKVSFFAIDRLLSYPQSNR